VSSIAPQFKSKGKSKKAKANSLFTVLVTKLQLGNALLEAPASLMESNQF
jgi:hypothetical protein